MVASKVVAIIAAKAVEAKSAFVMSSPDIRRAVNAPSKKLQQLYVSILCIVTMWTIRGEVKPHIAVGPTGTIKTDYVWLICN